MHFYKLLALNIFKIEWPLIQFLISFLQVFSHLRYLRRYVSLQRRTNFLKPFNLLFYNLIDFLSVFHRSILKLTNLKLCLLNSNIIISKFVCDLFPQSITLLFKISNQLLSWWVDFLDTLWRRCFDLPDDIRQRAQSFLQLRHYSPFSIKRVSFL